MDADERRAAKEELEAVTAELRDYNDRREAAPASLLARAVRAMLAADIDEGFLQAGGTFGELRARAQDGDEIAAIALADLVEDPFIREAIDTEPERP
jgi:hypothetical protein